MLVTVRLFAMLRQRAGADEIELELPEGARVVDALDRVGHLHNGVKLVLAVNRRYAAPDEQLHAGDELALIPPVSGGEQRPVSGGEQRPVSGGEQRPVSGGVQRPVSGGVQRPVSGGVQRPVSGGVQRHVRITAEPLLHDDLARSVADPRAGAIVIFSGVTREVEALHYEAYEEMAHERLGAIVAAAIERHGLCAAAAEHRVGRVPLGEPSVIVAASAPHRPAAFAGARELIDEIKAQAPIWKREGERWVEGTAPR